MGPDAVVGERMRVVSVEGGTLVVERTPPLPVGEGEAA
jgi:membrane protein implicated in regulation of membrane protease activity